MKEHTTNYPLFTGAATALATPFSGGELDLAAFESHVRWQIDMGVDALCIAGTTGEAATLTRSERRKLLAAAKPLAEGKVPLIVGCGSADTKTACTLCEDAEKLEDGDRYQTVYAKEEGSAAAPTAGLHFTNELLDRIREKGVAVVPVMLHVGLGTFRPVKESKVGDHVMHSEYFSVSPESADEINRRRAAGGRVIAVGTTSCRVLESASDENGILHPMADDTSIFIYPGYRFKMTDALITNFHLPESTLLMLVSAFYDREKMLEAYKLAVKEEYRFFSFGDAMLIV